MTGLADVDGFVICIQLCVWLGFRPLMSEIHFQLVTLSMLDHSLTWYVNHWFCCFYSGSEEDLLHWQELMLHGHSKILLITYMKRLNQCGTRTDLLAWLRVKVSSYCYSLARIFLHQLSVLCCGWWLVQLLYLFKVSFWPGIWQYVEDDFTQGEIQPTLGQIDQSIEKLIFKNIFF